MSVQGAPLEVVIVVPQDRPCAATVGAHHALPAALKAHEFRPRPGDQRPHYPERVDFAGHDVTFQHR
jgi:hypothetical protein